MEAQTFTNPNFIGNTNVEKVVGAGPVGIIEFKRRPYSQGEKWVVDISVYSTKGPKRVVCKGAFWYDTFPHGSTAPANALRGIIASAALHMTNNANKALEGSGVSITHSYQDYLAAVEETLSTPDQ